MKRYFIIFYTSYHVGKGQGFGYFPIEDINFPNRFDINESIERISKTDNSIMTNIIELKEADFISFTKQ